MREPSRRELFLQNRLALASTLLFSCSQVLSGHSKENRATLLIECEAFFSETRSLLAAEIAAETAEEESRSSAPPAERSGGEWNWEEWTGQQQTGSAQSDAGIKEKTSPGAFSEFSPGGIPSTEEPSPNNLIARIRHSLSTKQCKLLNGG